MAAPQINSMQRVKVYCLNDVGKWDDRGTGHVSMDYMERSQELGLYVVDEDDNATLLVHRICIHDIYKRQEDTIISWRDTERSTELALSFQEAAGCCFVWDQISVMRRNLNFNSLNNETFENVNNELREFPEVNVSNLPQILKIVTESYNTDRVRLAELMSKDNNFFQSLMNVFDICETSGNVKDLHIMFNIVRGIIALNSPPILEKILEDKLFMKIVGCLEYNPHVHKHQHHRKYLEEHGVFREAMPIKDPLVLTKIHQICRISFLKDVVLSRVLDDATYSNLNSRVAANKAAVLTSLKNDSTFFTGLFARLQSASTSVESRNSLVDFLNEFCGLSRTGLQDKDQNKFFQEFVNDTVFEIIAEVLKNPDKKLVLTGANILFNILSSHEPILLHSYVVRPESPLLGLLVKGMMEDFGDAMECQFIEIFRNLLLGPQRMNIVCIICEKHLLELVDFITESASRKVASHCGAEPKILLNICELLWLCCQQNSFRTNFLHKNLTEKVLLLTQRKEKFVVAAVIRVFRTLLHVLDDNVQSYVVKNNLMRPIIDVFVANIKRDNLISSAVLALFDHICKKKATVLLKYVVDTFWDQLAPFEHLKSIENLKTKSLGSMEQPSEGAADASTRGKEDAMPNTSNVEATVSVSQSNNGDKDDVDSNKPPAEKRPEEGKEDPVRVKNKTSPSKENEVEQSKRQKLVSTNEGNKNSAADEEKGSKGG